MKSFTCSNTFEEYKCSLLTKEDLLNGMPMVLGGITPCCLNIGATGGNFSLYSILDPNANFVVVKQNGKIISHALIWLSEDKKTIAIDILKDFIEKIINADGVVHSNEEKYFNQWKSEFCK